MGDLQSRLADAEREAKTARVVMVHAMYHAERLEEENFRLAAGTCIVDGGLVGDEGGTPVCALQEQLNEARETIARLNRERDRLLEALEPFAAASVQAKKIESSDILCVTHDMGPLGAMKDYEAARKVVEEMKSG